jgi:hypothetical protein
MDKVEEKVIEFEGPYSFIDYGDLPSILKSPLKNGIYLWAIPVDDKELIRYVGMTTRTFGERMLEHLKAYLSGDYGIYDPIELQSGRRVKLWDGYWRGAAIEDFIKRHEELFPKLFDMLKLYRIYVAPVNGEVRLLERIEAATAKHFYDQGGMVGDFQETGVRYKGRRKDENSVIVKLECNSQRIILPSTLEV